MPLQLDLLVHEHLGLLLHLGGDFLPDALALLDQLLLRLHILVFDQQQIVGQLLLLRLLLLNPRFLALDGQIKLLFLCQAPDLQMPALAVPHQVCRHVLEDRVEWHLLRRCHQLLIRIPAGQVVLAEDFVLAV